MQNEDQRSVDKTGTLLRRRRPPAGDGEPIAVAQAEISSRTVKSSLELIRLIEGIDLDDYFMNLPIRRHIRKILDGFSDQEFEFFCMIYTEILRRDERIDNRTDPSIKYYGI